MSKSLLVRQSLVVWCVLTAGSAILFPSASFAADKPNVLLICIDDLKPQLGCFGDATAISPNIDALAKRGVMFQSAYCNQAVCAPSRHSLLTGIRPQTFGIYDLATNFRRSLPNTITIGQAFQQHGYHTAALGKVFHVGHGNHEDAASWSEPHWRPSIAQYRLKSSLEDARVGSDRTRGKATESADVPDDAYADGLVAKEAERRLAAAAKTPGQPFFLAVGFLKPHLPFVAPKKYWDLYDPASLKLPELNHPPQGAPDFAPTTWGELRAYSDMPPKGPLSADQTRHLIHGYYAATSYTDAQIGLVLKALDDNGLAKNTIVVLWGDHGWHLGDHGMWCKHTNYEQATRIPVIVAAPGYAANAKTSALIETVDIYPTLCELAGFHAPAEAEGKSFVSVLKDPTASTRDSVIHVYPRGGLLGRAIRTDRYRLVEWKTPGAAAMTAQYELYDYQDDPTETRNLAGDLPEVVADLKQILAQHPEAKPQLKIAAQAAGNSNKGKPAVDRVALFKRRDVNQDGKLTEEEFLRGQPDPDEAPKRFPKFDANGDGVLSEEEFVFSGKVPLRGGK